MPFLDDLLGVHDISANGASPVKRRALLNFVGGSVMIQDNEVLGSTDVTVSTVAGTTITPPTIATSQINDYGPSGIVSAAVIRIASAVSGATITGLFYSVNQYPRPVLMNVGALTITLAHQSSASGSNHRFINTSGINYPLLPGGTVELVRDEVDNKWRLVLL